jgi:hypothetical protein
MCFETAKIIQFRPFQLYFEPLKAQPKVRSLNNHAVKRFCCFWRFNILSLRLKPICKICGKAICNASNVNCIQNGRKKCYICFVTFKCGKEQSSANVSKPQIDNKSHCWEKKKHCFAFNANKVRSHTTGIETKRMGAETEKNNKTNDKYEEQEEHSRIMKYEK